MRVTKKLLVAGSAIAMIVGNVSLSVAHAEDKTGWYGGLNVGRTHLKNGGGDFDSVFANQGLTTSSSIDKHDTAYSLNLGYQFNPYFAMEGGYVDFGKYSLRSAVSAPAADTISGRYKASGFDITAVGTLPLNNGFALFGKAGLIRSKAELDANSTGIAAVSGDSHRGTDATYGLGAKYDLTKDVVGKVEWNRYHDVGDSNVTGKSDIDLYSVGVAYKF